MFSDSDSGRGLRFFGSFCAVCQDPGQGAIRHLAFLVKDVDACVEKVRAAGYEITIEPKNIEFASVPPYPARIAFCIGPVGEEVEFFAER